MVFFSTVTKTKDINTMVSFIKQSLVLRISTQWFLYSTVIRTKDNKSIVSFIQQSLELRISNQWCILFNSH